jgi:hypothetical protein
MLIVGGLAIMRSRTMHLQTEADAGAPPPPPAGGWTGAETTPPPRWGLAGETINPELWGGSPSPQVAGDGRRAKSLWQNQFGNVALVVLVSVLAIGLWSNTSRLSPLREANVRDRFASEPFVLRTEGGIEELADTKLENGAFVIDATELQHGLYSPIEISMGSGRLELVVAPNTAVVGTVKSRTGSLVVRHLGRTTAAPVNFIQQTWSGTPYDTVAVDITADVGLVCIRTSDDKTGCSEPATTSSNRRTAIPTTATPPAAPAPAAPAPLTAPTPATPRSPERKS